MHAQEYYLVFQSLVWHVRLFESRDESDYGSYVHLWTIDHPMEWPDRRGRVHNQTQQHSGIESSSDGRRSLRIDTFWRALPSFIKLRANVPGRQNGKQSIAVGNGRQAQATLYSLVLWSLIDWMASILFALVPIPRPKDWIGAREMSVHVLALSVGALRQFLHHSETIIWIIINIYMLSWNIIDINNSWINLRDAYFQSHIGGALLSMPLAAWTPGPLVASFTQESVTVQPRYRRTSTNSATNMRCT